MTEAPTPHAVVLAAAGDPARRDLLAADLAAVAETTFAVEAVASGAGLRERIDEIQADGGRVPVVVVDGLLGDGAGVDVLIELTRRASSRSVRKVLLAGETERADVGRALSAKALDAVLAVPWTASQLEHTIHRLVTEYFIEEAPEAMEDVAEVVDVDLLSHAFAAAEDRRRRAEGRLQEFRRGLLGSREVSDTDVEAAMIAEIDEALGRPLRHTVPAGTVLLRSGDTVDTIRIVVEGRVRLTLEVDGREEVFHSHTAGRIIGLFALARAEPAFYNVIAADDTTLISMTLEELDEALRTSPMLAGHFVTVLLRAMVRRNLRTVELQIRVAQLARDLQQERDQLATALDQLGRAQARLVESEKLATLGQLVAGIAHELNNPVAAITRAADFLRRDVETVAGAGGAAFVAALRRAVDHPPRSTREERALRARMTAALGDETLANRLVRIGIVDPAEAGSELARAGDRETHLARLELFHEMGASLRAVHASSQRIAALVRSLRSYARAGQEMMDDVDVRTGLDETLLLLGHELRRVSVEREFGDVPSIRAIPGDLNQAWTNLIANAIQAMDDGGTLRVEVEGGDDEVVVRIIDSGHGIAADDLVQIFEPTFTTKQGRVEFGLGLGLQITKDIVVRHGGTIDVESRPGRTCFTVRLPVDTTPEEPHPPTRGETR